MLLGDDFIVYDLGEVLETVELNLFVVVVNLVWVSAGAASAR